jgi:hypothetical protein
MTQRVIHVLTRVLRVLMCLAGAAACEVAGVLVPMYLVFRWMTQAFVGNASGEGGALVGALFAATFGGAGALIAGAVGGFGAMLPAGYLLSKSGIRLRPASDDRPRRGRA